MIEAVPFYELAKIYIVALLGINADAVHIYAGLVTFFVTVFAFKQRGLTIWMLVPTLVVSILVEILDYHYAFRAVGWYDWSLSYRDIVNTNLLPIVLYVLLQLRLLPTGNLSGTR